MGAWAGKRERPCPNMDSARFLDQSRAMDPSPIYRDARARRYLGSSPAVAQTTPPLIWRVALPCSANAEHGDCQVSVPLTHSEGIRVRDQPNIPKACAAYVLPFR